MIVRTSGLLRGVGSYSFNEFVESVRPKISISVHAPQENVVLSVLLVVVPDVEDISVLLIRQDDADREKRNASLLLGILIARHLIYPVTPLPTIYRHGDNDRERKRERKTE